MFLRPTMYDARCLSTLPACMHNDAKDCRTNRGTDIESKPVLRHETASYDAPDYISDNHIETED